MSSKVFLARAAWCEANSGQPPQWLQQVFFRVDASGTISDLGIYDPASLPPQAHEIVHDLGHVAVVPGMVNAHSHAFQRRIRGRTSRRAAGDPSSFWSWRTAMYNEAAQLDPERVFAATRACYAEMAQAGITCVGEFHYVHHQNDGMPYDDANELSKAVIAAARDVGIRLTLLEVYYARAGFAQTLLPEQRRFCDASLDAYLQRVDDLRTWLGTTDDITLGLAPHSVRAVPASALAQLAHYAAAHEWVVHAHISEQVRENQECAQEYGCTPIDVFANAGLLARPRSFTAVHAIHVTPRDMDLMREQHVCACPSTEADLGDGIVPAAKWRENGALVSLGSDSNAVIDLVQEARFLEMNERLARQSRLVLTDANGEVAPSLVDAATRAGASSLGRANLGRLARGVPFDAVLFDLDHVTLRDVAVDDALEALFVAGSAAPCVQTWVRGQPLIVGRNHLRADRA